jgi:hypothetical protein
MVINKEKKDANDVASMVKHFLADYNLINKINYINIP